MRRSRSESKASFPTSATSSSSREERYIVSSWGRFIFLALLVFFASVCHPCQSFSPQPIIIIDSYHNTKNKRQCLTKIKVFETTEAPPHPVAPIEVGPFPSSPVFSSLSDATTIRCEAENNPTDSGIGDGDDDNDGVESSQQQRGRSNDDTYEGEGFDGDGDDDDDRTRRLGRTAMAADLLSRRNSQRSNNSVRQRATSVGARRIGSAGRARTKDSSMTKLADAVRKGASANTFPKRTTPTTTSDPSSPGRNGRKNTNNNNNNKNNKKNHGTTSGLMLTASAIHSSVQEMIGVLGKPASSPTAQTIPVGPRHQNNQQQQNPPPGTILVSTGQETKPWNPSHRVTVRVAKESDDLDIASLRLSVFSNFSAEMRRAFVARSCHVLATRRNRGATCIAATVPKYGSLLSQKPDIILGSAECSFHEFQGTNLGKRRPKDSILYVTEVAVSPTSRRKGIGFKLMKAIDKLAETRGAESLYLHVDVDNKGALSLYERCGYNRVSEQDSIYYEFTRSLNLHDGATKGRNHFLLYKDLKTPTWLPAMEPEHIEVVQRNALGFEIPV